MKFLYSLITIASIFNSKLSAQIAIPFNLFRTSTAVKLIPSDQQINNLKRSSTSQRLLANSSRKGTSGNKFINVDSAVYTYSGGRGGEFISEHYYFDGLLSNIRFDDANSWVYSNQKYKPSYHASKTWDGLNRPLTETVQVWNGSTWDNYKRNTHIYNGNQEVEIAENWESSTQSFKPYLKDSIIYLPQGLELEHYIFFWNTSVKVFEPNNLYSLQYDSRDNITELKSEYWDFKKKAWRDYSKYSYLYNDSNKNTNFKGSLWDTLSKTWKEDFNYRYMFDSDNHFLGRVSTTGENKIYTDSLINTSLNSSGGALTAVQYKWSNGWVPETKFTLTYLKPNLPVNQLYESWNGSAWVNYKRDIMFYDGWELLSDSYTEEWKNSTWTASITGGGERFYHEDYIVNSASPQKMELMANLFPVPANAFITIAIKWPSAQHIKAEIYNLEGKSIEQWEDNVSGIYTKDICIDQLKNGIYYIRISGEKDVYNSSFTVQH